MRFSELQKIFALRPPRRLHRFTPALLLLALPACFSGGVVEKGGYARDMGFRAQITPTRGAPYKVICIDEAEVKRREELSEEELARLGPPVRYESMYEYDGGCEFEGEHSTFFLFNLWPATPPLDPTYAAGKAVQSVEGDTMIHIRYWHETHYYSLLGRVMVLKVKGAVIRFLSEEELQQHEREQGRRDRRRR